MHFIRDHVGNLVFSVILRKSLIFIYIYILYIYTHKKSMELHKCVRSLALNNKNNMNNKKYVCFQDWTINSVLTLTVNFKKIL